MPIPIPDPAQPWGNSTCSKRSGVCYGHYLSQKYFNSVLPPQCWTHHEYWKKHWTLLTPTLENRQSQPSCLQKRWNMVWARANNQAKSLKGCWKGSSSYRSAEESCYCSIHLCVGEGDHWWNKKVGWAVITVVNFCRTYKDGSERLFLIWEQPNISPQ